MSPSSLRRGLALAVIAAAVLSSAGCHLLDNRGSQIDPSLPTAFGVRVTDGTLRIWTGSPCIGATSMTVEFDTNKARWELYRPGALSVPADDGPDPGTTVEYVTVGDPVAGLTADTSLPAGYDFHTAKTMTLSMRGPQTTWGQGVNLEEPLRDSDQHPQDTYWFSGVGWLNSADVAAKDGKEFLAFCTPNPDWADEVRVVGVRVTDGTLRTWTGSQCTRGDGAIVTFLPGPVNWVLGSSRATPEAYERLTVGKAPPGVPVDEPLPPDFDWRAERSVVFRLWGDGPTWTRPTDLAKVIAESAQHPDDVYYYEGFGWLDPADVEERDRKEFHTVCALK